MDWTNTIKTKIMHGIISLVSTEISQHLTWLKGSDLLLVLITLFRFTRYGSNRKLAMISRISTLLEQVLLGIILKLILESVVMTDPLLTLANVISVYLLSTVFRQSNLSGSSQYIFADTIVKQLNGWPDAILPAVVIIHYVSLRTGPRVHETMDLLAAHLVTAWLSQNIPNGMSIPTTILLIYILSALLDTFPLAVDLYSYALYTSSTELTIDRVELWLQGVAGFYIWKVGPDKVSKNLGKMASVSFFSTYVMQSINIIASTDPILATLIVAMSIGIIMEYSNHV